MKKVITGWIGKTQDFRIDNDGLYQANSVPDIYTRKGKEDEWPSIDWPPRKVRITIEEIRGGKK